MNINRYNYEEYFLLYTDNELSAVERQAVERFVKENPDLERELRLLTQSTFKPDDSIIFNHKALLIQAEENFIHAENCEHLFILYADDELTNDQKAVVEQFVYDNPQYQESLELMQLIKLSPDSSISFPNKRSLYRHEKETKPVVLWWRMAAAAVVLLFTGVLWLNNITSSKRSNKIVETGRKEDLKRANIAQNNITGKNAKGLPTPNPASLVDTISTSPANLARVDMSVMESAKQGLKHKTTVEANGIARVRAGNNLHVSDKTGKERVEDELERHADVHASDVAKFEPPTNAITSKKIEQAEQNSKMIADLTKTNAIAANTDNYANEAAFTSSSSNENVILANIPVDRKNSLRGLFRKASRLIDKTTSLRPSKRSGLAIGNIEIAFQ